MIGKIKVIWAKYKAAIMVGIMTLAIGIGILMVLLSILKHL
ncbi:MAG: hypothetical protein ABFC94_15970 [Syntrophomonas sp.]